MSKRPTLFRDFSPNSEKAESILKENEIDYVRQYVEPGGVRLPYLSHQSGVFQGDRGVQSFVDNYKEE